MDEMDGEVNSVGVDIDLREGSDVLPAGARPRALPAFGELPGLLVRASSGLDFIYRALELVAARYKLSDAVAVVDTPGGGSQMFRLGRGRLGTGTSQLWIRAAAAGGTGIFTEPATVLDPDTESYVTSLIALALRQDFLDHDARHDALTGLLNRRSFEGLLEDAVSRNRRYGWPFVLVLLDMDEFKSVNDRLGHAAGDAALRAVGSEIRACLRGGDVAARLGGDEFVLLLLNADAGAVLRSLTERLQSALDRVLPDAGVSFSTGAAGFPEDASDAAELMRVADDRLYAEKRTSFE